MIVLKQLAISFGGEALRKGKGEFSFQGCFLNSFTNTEVSTSRSEKNNITHVCTPSMKLDAALA